MSKALERKRAFINSLWKDLGEQKIDVVINIPSLKNELPIYSIAKKEGVKLV